MSKLDRCRVTTANEKITVIDWYRGNISKTALDVQKRKTINQSSAVLRTRQCRSRAAKTRDANLDFSLDRSISAGAGKLSMKAVPTSAKAQPRQRQWR
jgi:hypothetical protein